MNEPFLSMAMPLPDGTTEVLHLDEQAASEALAEMETWGEECSQDSKDLRQALRERFNNEIRRTNYKFRGLGRM